MPIIIYKTSVSPPSRATMMVVDILYLQVETREVNLPTREHYKPEYLKKNPLHTVPLLEEHDLILADSHAIMTYLVSKYGTEEHLKMYPLDLKKRALVDQRLFFDASILFPRLKTVIYSVVNGGVGPTSEQVADITEAYGFLEKYLEATPYLATDYVTLADISCVATVSSLDCIVAIDKEFVKLNEWWNRLKRENWYQKENEAGLALFRSFIQQFLRL